MCCCDHQVLHKQDSLWSWMVLLTATLAEGLELSMVYCFPVFFPVFMKEFKETSENIAWVSSIAFSISFISTPLSAVFCVRLGSRWTAVIGTFLCAACLVVSSFSSSLKLLYITYSAPFGFGANLLHVAGILLVQRYFKKRRSLATGIYACGSSVGTMLGPMFKVLLDKLGWRKTFYVVASFFLAPLVLSIVFFSPNVDDEQHKCAKHNVRKVAVSSPPRVKRWRHILCSFWNKLYTMGVLVVTLQIFALYVPLTYLVKHANNMGYSEKKSSMLLVYMGIASLIGKITAGRIIDSRKVTVFFLNQGAAFIVGGAAVLLNYASNDGGFIVFAFIYGFGNGCFVTTFFVILMNTVAVEHRPWGLACGEVIASLGVLTGTPFFGFIADQVGTYNTSFIASAAVLFIAGTIPFIRLCFNDKQLNETPDERQYVALFEREYVERETVL